MTASSTRSQRRTHPRSASHLRADAAVDWVYGASRRVEEPGGRVGEDIRGRDPLDVYQARIEIPQMRYLQCLPVRPDVLQIGRYLSTLDDTP